MKKWFSLLLALVMMLSFSFVVSAEPDSEYETRAILMEAFYEDGMIVATLVDDQQGTMSNWPVSLIVDGETVMTENTDYEGMVVLEYDIPSDAQIVECYAHDGGFDIFTFTGCTVYIDNFQTNDENDIEPDVDEEQESDEEVQAPSVDEEEEDQTPQTTTVTVPIVTQPGLLTSPITTMAQNNRVSVGVDAERALLTITQISDSEFSSKARLWMDTSVYEYHVPDALSSLHLQLTVNKEAGDISKLIAAKNSDSRFASYSDSEVKGFAVDTSIVYVDATSRVPLDNFQDGEYTIELPLPVTLRNCKTIAIAAYTESGSPKFGVCEPTNGMLQINVSRFQTFMIIGLGDRGAVANSLTETPTLLWVIIAVGVAMILGGILILVLVTFRRKKTGVEVTNESSQAVVLDSSDDTHAVLDDIPDAKEDKHDVVMDFDAQAVLSDEELMRFRSKPEADPNAFEFIKKEAVPPSKQSAVEQECLKIEESDETDSLNDLFDDMLSDLEDM